jgi:hypothetical protein
MNILTIIIIIILIIIIIILSFNNIIIEYFNTSSSVSITCGTSNINLDIACKKYNSTKNLIPDNENNYNIAKQNTLDKYDQWQFSKIIVNLKNTALDKAIIVDTNFNNRNTLKKMLYIIKCIIYSNVIIILINSNSNSNNEFNGYITDATNIYNYYAINANLKQINNSADGYSTPNEALNGALIEYNKSLSNLKNARIPNIEKLSEINSETSSNILDETLKDIVNLYSEINDNYLIPSLKDYNDQANISKNTIFNIDNLSSIKSTVENEYETAKTNERINILSALEEYKSAVSNELRKFNIFNEIINDLQTNFSDYTNLLNFPEYAYKINTENDKPRNIKDKTGCEVYNDYQLNIQVTDAFYAQENLKPGINNAMNICKQLPIKINIDKITLNDVSQYSGNREGSYSIKVSILQYIIDNDDVEKYKKQDLINASNKFNEDYKKSMNANDTVLKLLYEYNQMPEKIQYNELSKNFINKFNIYDKLNFDSKRCFPIDDIPTEATFTLGAIKFID